MSKGLEALEKLRNEATLPQQLKIPKSDQRYSDYLNKNLDIIEKELKALEIIKKSSDCELILAYDEEHNFWSLGGKQDDARFCIASGFGKEEYDLLKEVLR